MEAKDKNAYKQAKILYAYKSLSVPWKLNEPNRIELIHECTYRHRLLNPSDLRDIAKQVVKQIQEKGWHAAYTYSNATGNCFVTVENPEKEKALEVNSCHKSWIGLIVGIFSKPSKHGH